MFFPDVQPTQEYMQRALREAATNESSPSRNRAPVTDGYRYATAAGAVHPAAGCRSFNPAGVLYGHPVSQPSRSAQWFVDFAGLRDAVHVRTVDLGKGEHKSPEYVEKFPDGQVPSFETGGLRFSESAAILQYLAEGHWVFPPDPAHRAKVHEFFAKHASNARKFTAEYVFHALLGDPETKAQKVAEGKKVITPILQKFDALLGRQRFVLGNTLSLADFLFAPEVDQLVLVEADILAPYSNIRRYLSLLRTEVHGYARSFDGAIAAVNALRGA